MSRFSRSLSVALLATFVAVTASAQAWRGMGRLHGVVSDPSGKPIKGAKVLLRSVKGSDTGPEAILTDEKGRWTAGGLIGGQWNVDIDADGFLPRKLSANVSELERLVPPMKIQLERKPEEKPKPVEEQKEAIMVGGVEITPETAQSIEAGNNFIKEQKWKEAAAEYEKAVAALPTNSALKFALARAYHGMGDLKKAIAQLRDVYTADPGNITAATLLSDMLLQNEQVDEAKKVLDAMPEGSLADVDTILNIGIRFINNNKPEEAHKYFERAVAAGPDVAAAYYYRAIAALQLKKMKEAKADLQKVVAMAPDSAEAKDAKDLLAQMK